MDEMDKYKQRQEAIAEKRRLQEQQDKARREMEDEKIRQQQLKRKSLRDQWLMEGPPLSPTMDVQSPPRSPLWGSQAQEIEKHIDKLEEVEEKLKEQIEDGQEEAVKVSEARAEIVQDAVMQNGENNATGLETTEDKMETNQNLLLDETAAVLTNGKGDFEATTHHYAPEQSNQSTTNGPVVASESGISTKLEPGLDMGVSEAEPCDVPNVTIDEEEEEDEGTLVMRAERVIITDEGDDIPDNLTAQDAQQETLQSEETPPADPEAGKEGGEVLEEVGKTETASEIHTEPVESEAPKPTAEPQPANGDGDLLDGVTNNGNGDTETEPEGQDKPLEGPISLQVQSPANALEGTTVAPVPVYTEAQPSAFTPKLEAEVEASTSPEEAEAALKAQQPATPPGLFQEVPLADSQENQRTEAELGEQEPLLSQAKAPDTQAAAAAAAAAAKSPETHSPNRVSQGVETAAPKHKSCQCCSVM